MGGRHGGLVRTTNKYRAHVVSILLQLSKVLPSMNGPSTGLMIHLRFQSVRSSARDSHSSSFATSIPRHYCRVFNHNCAESIIVSSVHSPTLSRCRPLPCLALYRVTLRLITTRPGKTRRDMIFHGNVVPRRVFREKCLPHLCIGLFGTVLCPSLTGTCVNASL